MDSDDTGITKPWERIGQDIEQLKIDVAILKTVMENHIKHHNDMTKLIGFGVPIVVAILNGLFWLLIKG